MVQDQYGSPTSTDLVIIILKKVLINIRKNKFKSGIYNLCPSQYTSRYQLSRYIFNRYFDKTFSKNLKIRKINTKDLNLVANRPLNSRMNTYKISKFLDVEVKSWKFYLNKYLYYIKGKVWWKIEKEFF